MNFEELKTRLRKLDTAHIADADKSVRVMDPEIRPVRTGLRLIGRARTARCHEDFLTIIKALSDSTTNEVLVIDTRNSRAAVAGELFTTEAARRGLAGIVIDGACRDAKSIAEMDMPVYSRSVIPVSGTASKLFETQIPIECGSVRVEPGDIVFGDDDGLIVASENELDDLIPAAEAIQRTEQAVLERMQRGGGLLEMLNFDEHYENVKAGRQSSLKFLL
jgi:RraA family protein